MKRVGGKIDGGVVALALTWDGARWPVRSLPAKAQKFLTAKTARLMPSHFAIAQLLLAEEISELRVCWVPRLMGGEDVLAAPFGTREGTRIRFRSVQMREFGDVLGVVYRR